VAKLVEQNVMRLCSKLIPFFGSQHPSRGHVSGPFTRLSVGCNLRRLIIQVVVSLVSTVPSTESAKALLNAAEEATKKVKGAGEQVLRVLE
jgi:hypothetical protein